MINQADEGADQQARRTTVSIHIRAGKPANHLCLAELAGPLELVKNKQSTAAFDVFDQQAFAADVKVFLPENKQNQSREQPFLSW